MCTVSFKERVKNEAIANASLYQCNFIDYEYLVCSEAFNNGYHIIKSDKDWRHASFVCDENLILRFDDSTDIKSDWFVNAEELDS